MKRGTHVQITNAIDPELIGKCGIVTFISEEIIHVDIEGRFLSAECKKEDLKRIRPYVPFAEREEHARYLREDKIRKIMRHAGLISSSSFFMRKEINLDERTLDQFSNQTLNALLKDLQKMYKEGKKIEQQYLNNRR